MKKGKFIVIDGTDGSGKATQTALLVGRLKREKIKVKKIDFPQYEKNFFGKLIGEALRGEYGDFIAVDPHIASVLYAADRWESSEDIGLWLSKGYTVVADRYVSANQIHQGGKISDNKKRKEFLNWLDTMEHKVFKIPRPDVVIYLDLPVEMSLRLLSEKAMADKKKYLKGEKDLAESNIRHLEESRRGGIKIVESLNNWHNIDCSQNGEILSREAIHDKIFEKVRKLLKVR